MAGLAEQSGIYNNLVNGYANQQERAENQKNALNKLIENCNNLFDTVGNFFGTIFNNWQLVLLGCVACLILWKRI